MYVYAGDRFSSGRTRHERLDAVELTLRELPLSFLSQLQLLLYHSVRADIINDCIRRRRRHESQFSSDASRAGRTAEDSTQSLNSVPGHVVTAATHFPPTLRQFTTGYTVNNQLLSSGYSYR